MSDVRELGGVIIVVGLAVVAVGVAASLGGPSWFGRLPGDLRIEREGVRVLVPLTSMMLVSLALSLLIAVLRRLG